ncbi:Uma2 family endonuclease [Spirillospora sp. CA-253888]
MSIIVQYTDPTALPDTPYNMWANGELDDFVHAPEGSKVEVIGGRIVVSPAPVVRHNTIIYAVSDALTFARAGNPGFPWRPIQTSRVGFTGIGDGYVPDLIVLDAAMLVEAEDADVQGFVPDQIEMAVEVTSPGNAGDDRRPSAHRGQEQRPTKWTGYARAEIPYYLLVDRDPKVASTTLYSIPDQATGAYLHKETWAFGETVLLPEPFGIEIDTSRWKPWKP